MNLVEKIIFFGDRRDAAIWNHCRGAMRQAGGLDLMLELRSELEAEGDKYAVVRENRGVMDPYRNTLTLRWDLKETPGRCLSRGIKLEADEEGRISVFHTGGAHSWDSLGGEISLEKKARLAMSLASHHPDRFHSNQLVDRLERVIDFFEARKVA